MSRIFVKNLPPNVTEDVLKNKFSQIGHVTDVKIARKRFVELVAVLDSVLRE